jgi:hypothetical protein
VIVRMLFRNPKVSSFFLACHRWMLGSENRSPRFGTMGMSLTRNRQRRSFTLPVRLLAPRVLALQQCRSCRGFVSWLHEISPTSLSSCWTKYDRTASQ